jgi:hypothetical protein
MKKLPPLFGFECETNERGTVSIDVNCEFPQQRDNCLNLYNRLEELKIIDSEISFPLRLKHFIVTINPTDKFTIMNYFRIDGIKKIVEENDVDDSSNHCITIFRVCRAEKVYS